MDYLAHPYSMVSVLARHSIITCLPKPSPIVAAPIVLRRLLGRSNSTVDLRPLIPIRHLHRPFLSMAVKTHHVGHPQSRATIRRVLESPVTTR